MLRFFFVNLNTETRTQKINLKKNQSRKNNNNFKIGFYPADYICLPTICIFFQKLFNNDRSLTWVFPLLELAVNKAEA